MRRATFAELAQRGAEAEPALRAALKQTVCADGEAAAARVARRAYYYDVPGVIAQASRGSGAGKDRHAGSEEDSRSTTADSRTVGQGAGRVRKQPEWNGARGTAGPTRRDLDDRFRSSPPVKRSRIRQNAGGVTRILANAATNEWRRTYETVIWLPSVCAVDKCCTNMKRLPR